MYILQWSLKSFDYTPCSKNLFDHAPTKHIYVFIKNIRLLLINIIALPNIYKVRNKV